MSDSHTHVEEPDDSIIKVLDHGYVRLVEHMGSDLSIVRSARVSHDADWRDHGEKNDNRLIRYLLMNRHTSPFESVVFTFEVKAPIFIFRQWHRHRTWSYNEVSARYTELPEEFYVPEPEHIGIQSQTNHQAREMIGAANYQARGLIKGIDTASFRAYKDLLKGGVPRELARSVLPVATYSRMFATIDLHNLFHFLTLRDDNHAQYEIQVYARAMKQLVEPLVPVAMGVFDEYLARKEREKELFEKYGYDD